MDQSSAAGGRVHFSLLTAAMLLSGAQALAQAPAETPTPPPAETSPAPAAEPAPAPTPAPAPAPSASAISMDPAVAQQTFTAQKLQRKQLKETDPLYVPTLRAMPDDSIAPWAVYRGDGSVLTARDLAVAFDDKALVTKLDKGVKRSKILRWTLTGTGAALVGLAVVPLLGMEDVGDLGREPLQDNYTSAEEYTAALTAWRQQREDANQNQNRLLSSVTLGASGALAIAVSPFATVGVQERQKISQVYYTADQTDEKILSHNVKLKRQLGLVAPDPTEVIITPPPQPQGLPEEGEDEDIDIPEPKGGGGLPPLMESAPVLELSPVIGLGFLGLQGSF